MTAPSNRFSKHKGLSRRRRTVPHTLGSSWPRKSRNGEMSSSRLVCGLNEVGRGALGGHGPPRAGESYVVNFQRFGTSERTGSEYLWTRCIWLLFFDCTLQQEFELLADLLQRLRAPRGPAHRDRAFDRRDYKCCEAPRARRGEAFALQRSG